MDQNKIDGFDMNNVDQWIQNSAAQEPAAGIVPMANAAADFVFNQTKKLAGTMVEYRELMMRYSCAIKEIKTKFEVLNTEFNVQYQRNPISAITSRLKRTSSIVEKLERDNRRFSLKEIEENINDVAGVRVICSYIDDIYQVADALLKQDDITLIKRKDYIANPKPNGYRSLHLIVSVPVFFAERKKEMKVEVQIRTIAMDFWASLEHQLKYKQEIPDQQNIIDQLKECADVITATDEKMLEIRRQIETMSDTPTEDDILIEKLSRLDFKVD